MGEEFLNRNDLWDFLPRCWHSVESPAVFKVPFLEIGFNKGSWAGLLYSLTTSVPQRDLRGDPPLSFPHCSCFPSPPGLVAVIHPFSEAGLMRIILKSIRSAGEHRAALERQAIHFWSLLESTTQGAGHEWRKGAHAMGKAWAGCSTQVNAKLLPNTSQWFMVCPDDGAHPDQRGINVLVINGKKRESCQGNVSVKAAEHLNAPGVTQ